MEKLFNTFSIYLGIVGGILGYWMGGWDDMLKAIAFMAAADYCTGVIKAIYQKKLSSEIGFEGILKKIVMFIVIAVAYDIQRLIGDNIPLREIVIMFYIANEGLSIIENAAIFVPIPEKLKNVLLQLREKEEQS
jgi:toxin secretion/phage lysis holin